MILEKRIRAWDTLIPENSKQLSPEVVLYRCSGCPVRVSISPVSQILPCVLCVPRLFGSPNSGGLGEVCRHDTGGTNNICNHSKGRIYLHQFQIQRIQMQTIVQYSTCFNHSGVIANCNSSCPITISRARLYYGQLACVMPL